MEPLDTTYSPQPLMSEQHEAITSYHRKRKMVTIAVICGVIIIGLGLWWWFTRSRTYTPAETLVNLAATSQPVTKSEEDRAADMQAFAGPAKKQTPAVSAMTVSKQLQLLQSLDKK